MKKQKNIAALLLFFGACLFGGMSFGAEYPALEIPLWPKEKLTMQAEPEKVIEKSKDPAKHFRSVFNVSIPTITVYLPAASGTVPAIVICPGGAYGGLALDIEGHAVARWLNELGVAGVVLKDRVPTQNGDGRHVLPLQDAQRALGIVRSRAKEWNIDPQRIGIMGFSAGGHLAANASNQFASRAYEPVDAADEASCRPDFSILIYPAYLLQSGTGPDLIPELKVTSSTPPAFLAHAGDDPIRVENSLFYYLALKNAQVPVQMSLFASGGHGYGLGVRGGPVANWPRHCAEWMRERGILEKDCCARNDN